MYHLRPNAGDFALPVVEYIRADLAQAQASGQAALSDADIQAIWYVACHDTPKTPGWNRHIRFARALLSRYGQAPAASVAPSDSESTDTMKTRD